MGGDAEQSRQCVATLGKHESGTARLEEAINAYREALKERSREGVPLQWAASFGNQGFAMMLLADRTNDDAMAETAFQQIQTAVETLRSGDSSNGRQSSKPNCRRPMRSGSG